MNGRQWMALMEAHFPEDLAESWDNVGLLCGDPDREVHSVYIALDATSQVVKDAVGCKADILLTHHPLIFSPLKRIVSDDFVGKRLIKLMENHMIYYAMHTNYDIRRMADIASERLDLTDPCPLEVIGEAGEGIGRTGDLKEPLSLADCARFARSRTFAYLATRISSSGECLSVLDREREWKERLWGKGQMCSLQEILDIMMVSMLWRGDWR